MKAGFSGRCIRKAERGVALIIGLILLTVMSLLGISAVRTISKEERMVTQTLDRSLSFQAAESALREAEALIEAALRPSPAPSTACAVTGTAPKQLMVCGFEPTPTIARWIDPTFDKWRTATAVGSDSFKITPEYFVEYLGDGFPCRLDNASEPSCKRYRVSARGKPAEDRSSVVLQSIYATYEP